MDRAVTADYFASLHRDGADRLAVACHTGRGSELSLVELEHVTAQAATTVTDPVVGVPWMPRTTDRRTWAQCARDAGAGALMLFPPPTGTPGPEALRAHEETHEASGLPVIAFALYSSLYSEDVVTALVGSPAISAIKSAFLDDRDGAARMLDLASAAQTRAISGEDLFLGATLRWGFDGALVGLAAAATPVCRVLVDLVRHVRSGELGSEARCTAFEQVVDTFAAVCFPGRGDAYIQHMAWIAEDEGRLPPAFSTQRVNDTGDRSAVVEAARSALRLADRAKTGVIWS
jgi:dihydrodipicolinate synthase/N-acetylneuraminate lyase